MSGAATRALFTQLTAESGTSARTFKSALLWAVAEDGAALAEEARKLLAWKDIEADSTTLKLDEAQHRLLVESVKRAERDLREAVWRSYKNVFLLAEDNTFRRIDLGLVHSSAAASLVELIVTRLKQEDLVSEGVSPSFLTRYWPPALAEWSTKSVRDAFFASPKFPRLIKADSVRDTISRGLDAGLFAYIGKSASGQYEPFIYKRSLAGTDVEISEDVFLISRESAEEYLKANEAGVVQGVAPPAGTPGAAGTGTDAATPVVAAAIQSVFEDHEFEELTVRVRTELLPRLNDVLSDWQGNRGSDESPDEHMQPLLDSFEALKRLFDEDEDAVKLVERETRRAAEWIAEHMPEEPDAKRSRSLGGGQAPDTLQGDRSIFDDIDA